FLKSGSLGAILHHMHDNTLQTTEDHIGALWVISLDVLLDRGGHILNNCLHTTISGNFSCQQVVFHVEPKQGHGNLSSGHVFHLVVNSHSTIPIQQVHDHVQQDNVDIIAESI